MAASGGIDDHGPVGEATAAELAERLVVEDALRVGRQRQQVHENIDAAEEAVELFRPGELLDALEALPARAPCTQLVAEDLEVADRVLPEDTSSPLCPPSRRRPATDRAAPSASPSGPAGTGCRAACAW